MAEFLLVKIWVFLNFLWREAFPRPTFQKNNLPWVPRKAGPRRDVPELRGADTAAAEAARLRHGRRGRRGRGRFRFPRLCRFRGRGPPRRQEEAETRGETRDGGRREREASGDTEAAATAPSPCTEAERTAGRRRGTHGLPGSSGGRGRLRAPAPPGRRTSRPSSK